MNIKSREASPRLQAALLKNGIDVNALASMPESDALSLELVGPAIFAEARKLTDKRGGARAGAGRKAKDGATDLVQVAVWVTRPQREKLRRIGHSVWMRKAITDAPEAESTDQDQNDP